MATNLQQCYELTRTVYNQKTSNLLKNFMKLNKQFIHHGASRRFLIRCRARDVTPKHINDRMKSLLSTHFYSHTQKDKFNGKFCDYIKSSILNFEISDIHSHLNHLNKKMNKLKTVINSIVRDVRITKKFFGLCREKLLQLITVFIINSIKNSTTF